MTQPRPLSVPRTWWLWLVGLLALGGCDADPDAGGDAEAHSVDAGPRTSIDGGDAVDAAPVDAGLPPLPACETATDRGWSVCSDEGDRCSVAFDDGEGCAAVCEAIGRRCVDAIDTPGTGCEDNGVSLGCAPTGHGSDRCVCDRAGAPDAGPFDAGPPVDGGTGHDVELRTRKAFPSAQGLGAEDIEGARTGTIFFVTDLSNTSSGEYDAATDTHTGTLRYALEHEDSGTIVFRTAGVVRPGSGASYRFTQRGAHKTILGATAPSPGVVFYDGPFIVAARESQWIVRGMTFLGGSGLEPGRHDAFSVDGPTHVALSDNTFGWGADEAFTVRRFERLVAQRNVGLEGHPAHNVGSIFAFDTLGGGTGRLLSAHDNAYIHVGHRFPNTQGLEGDRVEVVNQFAYNWNRRTESHKFQARHNDINNYYRRGPRTSSSPHKLWNAHREDDSPFWDPPPAFYTAGNIMTGFFDDPTADNRALWFHHITSNGYTAGEPLPASFFVDTPHPLGVDIAPRTAREAYEYNVVGRRVGARYVVDAEGRRQSYMLPLLEAYLDDAVAGTDDAFRDDASRFVLPTLPAAGAPYEDSDRDGMADAWEREHGLVVGERDHMGVRDRWTLEGVTFLNTAGYTNLEIFGDWAHGGFVILRDATVAAP